MERMGRLIIISVWRNAKVLTLRVPEDAHASYVPARKSSNQFVESMEKSTATVVWQSVLE